MWPIDGGRVGGTWWVGDVANSGWVGDVANSGWVDEWEKHVHVMCGGLRESCVGAMCLIGLAQSVLCVTRGMAILLLTSWAVCVCPPVDKLSCVCALLLSSWAVCVPSC